MFRAIGFKCLLTAVAIILLLAPACLAQIGWTLHTIAGNFDGAYCVYAADVDSDGDMDVLGAAYMADDITWWENDGEETFTEHTIGGNFDNPRCVYAIDLDDDGDMDVLGAALDADDITWWENDGDQDFTEHTIEGDFDGAFSVYATDIDGDNDIDVLGSAFYDSVFTWWENDGNEDFTEHTFAEDMDWAVDVFAMDVDSDDDIDLLGAGGTRIDGYITWWENDGDQEFTEHALTTTFAYAHAVYAADVDGDDDIDVLGAAYEADSVKWWENDGDQEFTEHTIAVFDGVQDVFAIDVDLDEDIDVIAASRSLSDIKWWENDGEDPVGWTEYTINGNFNNARSVYAVDVDNDGDIDVLGAAYAADDIAWWESDLDPPGNCTADGTITDAETGDTIEDAEINYGEEDAVTNEDGYYFIEGLHPVQYTVIIEAEGYATYTEPGIEIEDGANTYDFELHYPSSIVIDPDSLELICPEGETDSSTFTIGNEGGVDLHWRIDTGGNDWLSVDVESGRVEPDSEFVVTVIGDAGELTEDIYEPVLEIITNDPENTEVEVYIIFYVGFDPPDAFNLISPDSAFWSFDTEVELEWEEATDLDPEDEVVYDLFLAGDPDSLIDPIATDLTETTWIFDAPLQQDYFWKVRARDLLDMQTWSNQTWSFFVDYPEPPTPFYLLEPEDGAVIDFGDELQEETDIEFIWEASIDPDPQDSPTYTLNFIVTLPDDSTETLEVPRLRDTVQTVDLPAELELGGWDEPLSVEWWVVASSGEDVLECEQHFFFTVTPYSGIPDKLFSGVPAEFGIVAAYPNPFNSSLTVVVGIPQHSRLKINMFNLVGREVAVIADDFVDQGYRKFIFNANGLSSGIYFIQMNVPGRKKDIMKLVLIQ